MSLFPTISSQPHGPEKTNWLAAGPFIGVHLMCLFVFVTGVSWISLGVCVALYLIRMFGITGGYHRYFSHRSYKTSRWFQFFLALLGSSAVQKGPLWWAGHHRKHHKNSDTPLDVHSPLQRGFWYSHMGWILSNKYNHTEEKVVQDLSKYPELRFLNKHILVVPVSLAVLLFVSGLLLQTYAPSLGVTGFQLLVWGFFVSTTLLYHGVFTINSLSHVFGKQRFYTTDTSRNNFWLSLITLGEGWHNNHHRFPFAEKHALRWWEFDATHYALRILSWFGLVWDLRTVKKEEIAAALKGADPLPDVSLNKLDLRSTLSPLAPGQ